MSASSAGTGRGGHWIKPVLVQLGGKTAVLALFAVLILVVLVALSESRPITAARDAILNEHMWEQAYRRQAPEVPGAIVFVGFDKVSCEDRQQIKGECQLAGLIDRDWIAEMVRTAVYAKPAAILVDVTPRLATCDEGTAALTAAILDASRQAPVVLVRPLIGEGRLLDSGDTLLDQCPGLLAPEDHARLARGDGIFFGHAFLRSSQSGAPIDSLRPWVSAIIPGLGPEGLTAGDGQTVRIPAISLIASLAMQLRDQKKLFKTLQDSGLETRWRANQQIGKEPRPLVSCLFAEKGCPAIETGGDALEASPIRINFRFGWDADRQEDRTGNYKKLMPISAIDFNERGALDLIEQLGPETATVILIASAMPEYGDFHFTPIGQLPGGIVNANAVFGFATTGGLLSSPERLDVFIHGLKHLFFFVAAVVAVTVALAFLVCLLARLVGRSPAPDKVIGVTWYFALAGIAIVDAVLAWGRLHEDFDKGILSFALLGAILALSKLLGVLEHWLTGFVRGMLGSLAGKAPDPEPDGPRHVAAGE